MLCSSGFFSKKKKCFLFSQLCSLNQFEPFCTLEVAFNTLAIKQWCYCFHIDFLPQSILFTNLLPPVSFIRKRKWKNKQMSCAIKMVLSVLHRVAFANAVTIRASERMVNGIALTPNWIETFHKAWAGLWKIINWWINKERVEGRKNMHTARTRNISAKRIGRTESSVCAN